MMPDKQDVKATWREVRGDRLRGRELVNVTMLEPRPRQCNRYCPWRTENHGQTVPFEYDHEIQGVPTGPTCDFGLENYRKWWDHLSTGKLGDWRNLCHVCRRGTDITTGTQVACQCTGSLVLQQRELLRHVEHGQSALTAEGAARVAGDMLGRHLGDVAGLDVRELLEHGSPSLLDPQIGSPHLAPLSEREVNEWAR